MHACKRKRTDVRIRMYALQIQDARIARRHGAIMYVLHLIANMYAYT